MEETKGATAHVMEDDAFWEQPKSTPNIILL
jgi:hypothetical protein